MAAMHHHILQLEEKLQLLLKEYYRLQKEVLRLERQNEALKSQVQLHKEQAARLAQTVDVLKIKGIADTDTSKKDLEKRINGYLKEIDHCLMLLQS